MDATSESEFSGEELSDSTLTGDRSVCLGFFVNMVGFPIKLSLSDLFFVDFLVFLSVAFRAEGPPTSKTLLMPWGSNLTIVDFTILAAAVYSPKPSEPGK
jgi:hypothetical protein